jgi:RNA polymerase sigma factor (TIGR02999 family)
MSIVTQILEKIEGGDPSAHEKLLPLVYEELRKLAADQMASERVDHTLEATALVHEAYVRLVDGSAQHWNSRGHFYVAAATAMRRILVEHARRKQSVKQGGELQRVDLKDPPAAAEDKKLLALDEAIDELAKEDPVAAKVVELRRFAGLNHEKIAVTLTITVYQARQKWTYARAWLRAFFKGNE